MVSMWSSLVHTLAGFATFGCASWVTSSPTTSAATSYTDFRTLITPRASINPLVGSHQVLLPLVILLHRHPAVCQTLIHARDALCVWVWAVNEMIYAQSSSTHLILSFPRNELLHVLSYYPLHHIFYATPIIPSPFHPSSFYLVTYRLSVL